MDISEIYKKYIACNQKICTDTRKIVKGSMFFALKGENFDGNKYAEKAIELGARYVVVDDKSLKGNNLISVDNVLATLQELGLYHRNKLKIPVLAITGSNGKTTTKELIKEVLSRKYRVAYTKGNFNNHIGIPLTLLDINPFDQLSIVEMGANHKGEIQSYCTYTEPDYGMITNIGKAHLEGFGGIEGVIQGKTELYNHLKDSDKMVFVNENDEILMEKSDGMRRTLYSTTSFGESKLQIDSVDGLLNIQFLYEDEPFSIHTNLSGEYNIPNIMAAVCIGRHFEVDMKDIKSAIESYIPQNNRSQLIEKSHYKIILDAYNANPSSMKVALSQLEQYDGKKIAILGCMKEMGEYSEDEHRDLIAFALGKAIDTIVVIGEEFKNGVDDKVLYFEEFEQAKKWYDSQNWEDGSTLLIKGSRGIALERLLQ